MRNHGVWREPVQASFATDGFGRLFVNTNRFKANEAQYYGAHTVRLPVATADTARLIRAAMHGLACIYKPGFSYKKAGVICLDLHPASAVQSTLFHQPDDPGRVELMRIMDSLNRRYGRGKVAFAAAGTQRAWGLRSDHLSARFTTDWKELLRV